MKRRWPLLILIAVYLLTRLVNITSNPPSLYWDEASIAYNAYSVITTGYDEWGKYYPVNFRAFGEFKLPIYIYSVALFEKFLGLSVVSVRIPAVLYSLGTLIVLYFLVLRFKLSRTSAFMAGLFFILNPWNFIISRAGYEANAGLFFYLLGVYLCTFRRIIFWIISGVSLVLSYYSYNSYRIIVPVTAAMGVGYWFFNKKVLPSKNLIVLVFIIFSLFIPVVRSYIFDIVGRRSQEISIFNHSKNLGELVISFFYNFYLNLSPDFLLINGDRNLRSHFTGFGEVFLPTALLIILGVVFIFGRSKYLFIVILSLISISILPSAITIEAPHSLRTINLFVVLCLLTGIGVEYILIYFPKPRVWIMTLILVQVIFFGNYYYKFLNDYPKISSGQWQYSYNYFFEVYEDRFNLYDFVYVDDRYTQPYIFGLYNLKYSPERFLQSVSYNSPDRWGISTVCKYDKFIFSSQCSRDKGKGLLALSYKSNDPKLYLIDQIKDLDNFISLYIYETQK